MLVFIKKAFNIFLIRESKIDDSFPYTQFTTEGYKSFREDRDAFGGEQLYYVNKKLNCRSLKICIPNTFIEILPLELRFLNSKWLIIGLISLLLKKNQFTPLKFKNYWHVHRSSYDNILLLGDFNMSFYNKNVKNLRDMFEPNHLIKGIVMLIEKALIIDRLFVSKVFWKFCIPTIYNFAVVHPWNLVFY